MKRILITVALLTLCATFVLHATPPDTSLAKRRTAFRSGHLVMKGVMRNPMATGMDNELEIDMWFDAYGTKIRMEVHMTGEKRQIMISSDTQNLSYRVFESRSGGPAMLEPRSGSDNNDALFFFEEGRRAFMNEMLRSFKGLTKQPAPVFKPIQDTIILGKQCMGYGFTSKDVSVRTWYWDQLTMCVDVRVQEDRRNMALSLYATQIDVNIPVPEGMFGMPSGMGLYNRDSAYAADEALRAGAEDVIRAETAPYHLLPADHPPAFAYGTLTLITPPSAALSDPVISAVHIWYHDHGNRLMTRMDMPWQASTVMYDSGRKYTWSTFSAQSDTLLAQYCTGPAGDTLNLELRQCMMTAHQEDLSGDLANLFLADRIVNDILEGTGYTPRHLVTRIQDTLIAEQICTGYRIGADSLPGAVAQVWLWEQMPLLITVDTKAQGSARWQRVMELVAARVNVKTPVPPEQFSVPADMTVNTDYTEVAQPAVAVPAEAVKPSPKKKKSRR